MSAIDDYLDGLPRAQKDAFERVRAVVARVAAEAEEGKSYGMPAFLYAGRPLLGLRAAKKHLSLFPFSPAAIEAVRDRLQGFDVSKGTIRFSPEHPVPEDVLSDIVAARKREITKGADHAEPGRGLPSVDAGASGPRGGGPVSEPIRSRRALVDR
jgi:uncharacterized protein YdhG (YjbR/CyaY superfamily)